MKILCEFEYCGPSFVRSGWGRVFAALGHQFQFWLPKEKPAFDAFSEFEPDLFLGTTFTLTRAVEKCIRTRPGMRVILYASAWGDLIKEIPLDKYPIVAVGDEEKRQLEKLKQETGRPDFVWLHYHDNWVDRTLGGWKSIGIKPVGLMNAADTFMYLDGTYRQALASDVSFVGGYWDYKARNLDKYIIPLCHSDRGLKVKIFGNQNWPVAQFLGLIQDERVKDVFRSATVCPSASEPHSTDFGFDIIERPFKILSSGGFCVSDYVQSMAEDVFNGDEIPFAENATDFIDLVESFVNCPENRIPYMERGYRKVLTEHTYFHRVARLFEKLGMPEESARTMAAHKDLVLKGRE